MKIDPVSLYESNSRMLVIANVCFDSSIKSVVKSWYRLAFSWEIFKISQQPVIIDTVLPKTIKRFLKQDEEWVFATF